MHPGNCQSIQETCAMKTEIGTIGDCMASNHLPFSVPGMTCRGIGSLKVAAFVVVLGGSGAFGQFSVLHSFTGGTDGANPQYGAPAVSDSTVYGTTGAGGSGNGVVFSVGTDGSGFNVLHTFTAVAPDGAKPYGSVTLDGRLFTARPMEAALAARERFTRSVSAGLVIKCCTVSLPQLITTRIAL